jgi:hypothetical protein
VTGATKHKKYEGFSGFVLCEYLPQKFKSVYNAEKEVTW